MSNTSRLVDKLIDKGWVSRDMCKYNRRKVEIFITENGLNALQQLDDLVVNEERQIMGMLSEKKTKKPSQANGKSSCLLTNFFWLLICASRSEHVYLTNEM